LNYYQEMKKALAAELAEGWDEGLEEEQIEIALEMLGEGESVEKVADFTGLYLAIVKVLEHKRRQ